MIDLRRYLSYAVLVVACIATLATSQPIGISRQIDGQTVANGESPVIEGSIGIPRNPVSFESLLVSITIAGRGLGREGASGAYEGRVATADDELGLWLAMPVTAQVSSSIACGEPSYCEIPFRFQLRPAYAQRSTGVVLPWHIDVFVAGNVESADLIVSTENAGPSATAVAFLSSLLGILAGLTSVFIVGRSPSSRRRTPLVAVALLAAAFALIVLGEGVLIERLPANVVIATAIAFIPLPLALPKRSGTGAQGGVLAVALLGAPLLLGLTNDLGIFRVVDVAVLFGVIGLLFPVGFALLLSTRTQPTQPAANRRREWRSVLLLAGFLLGLIWLWTLVVAGGGTDYSLFYLGIPVISVALLAWGTWCWWDRSFGTPLAFTGILLPIFAALGFFAARFPYFWSENHEPIGVLPSLIAIFVGGVALTVMTSWPYRTSG